MDSLEDYEDEYRTLEELGKGKFGVVYKVEDKRAGYSAAAKHIRVRTQKEKVRVEEEVDILRSLDNPYIIQFYAAYAGLKEIVVVTEYLDGGELFERVCSQTFNLTEHDCSMYIRQLCEGLSYLHGASIVHLDLKPENIVCKDSQSTDIKIIDFGLAKRISPNQQFRTLSGTPEFLAPEILNYECVTCKTDMWAVGVIAYVLLSGLSPFLGDNDLDTYANIQMCSYTFEEEEFDQVSDTAMDFIKSLLVLTSAKRLAADQCLDDDWLHQHGQRGSLTTNLSKNMRKFINRRQWQKFAQAVKAVERLSAKRSTHSVDEHEAEINESLDISEDGESGDTSNNDYITPDQNCEDWQSERDEITTSEEQIEHLSTMSPRNSLTTSTVSIANFPTSNDSLNHSVTDSPKKSSPLDTSMESPVTLRRVSPRPTINQSTPSPPPTTIYQSTPSPPPTTSQSTLYTTKAIANTFNSCTGIRSDNLETNSSQDELMLNEEANESSDSFPSSSSIRVPDFLKEYKRNSRLTPGTVSGMINQMNRPQTTTTQHIIQRKNRQSMKTRPQNVKILSEKFNSVQ